MRTRRGATLISCLLSVATAGCYLSHERPSEGRDAGEADVFREDAPVVRERCNGAPVDEGPFVDVTPPAPGTVAFELVEAPRVLLTGLELGGRASPQISWNGGRFTLLSSGVPARAMVLDAEGRGIGEPTLLETSAHGYSVDAAGSRVGFIAHGEGGRLFVVVDSSDGRVTALSPPRAALGSTLATAGDGDCWAIAGLVGGDDDAGEARLVFVASNGEVLHGPHVLSPDARGSPVIVSHEERTLVFWPQPRSAREWVFAGRVFVRGVPAEPLELEYRLHAHSLVATASIRDRVILAGRGRDSRRTRLLAVDPNTGALLHESDFGPEREHADSRDVTVVAAPREGFVAVCSAVDRGIEIRAVGLDVQPWGEPLLIDDPGVVGLSCTWTGTELVVAWTRAVGAISALVARVRPTFL